MKPEAQRAAIAEACGFTDIQTFDQWKSGTYLPHGTLCGKNGRWLVPLPPYLSCLNAMHEAEKILRRDPIAWQRFVDKLNESISLDDAIHATAAQRAEAFLCTLNLWEP